MRFPTAIAGIGTTNINADSFIKDRVNFIGSNFVGQTTSPNSDDHLPFFGQLDQNNIMNLKKDEPSYIVYSYATPIAWFGKIGWVLPAIKYSQTTSRHQSIVRRAISC
jgi:hypothetical protein